MRSDVELKVEQMFRNRRSMSELEKLKVDFASLSQQQLLRCNFLSVASFYKSTICCYEFESRTECLSGLCDDILKLLEAPRHKMRR